MFTAKDALYQSMAYTDKSISSIPTPTSSFSKFIVTVTISSDGTATCDKTFSQTVEAIEDDNTVVFANVVNNIHSDTCFRNTYKNVGVVYEYGDYPKIHMQLMYCGDGEVSVLGITLHEDNTITYVEEYATFSVRS